MIRFACNGCGANFKVDDSKAGKKGKCPKCGAALAIPSPEAELDFAEELIDPRMATPIPTAKVSRSSGGRSICPSCDQTLAANAVICVRCGVKASSGRPVMTSFEPDLDDLYTRAETIVGWLSWLFPTGLHPIAAEAGGGKRPVATWLIFAITVLASVGFFAANMGGDGKAAMNLMLWDNDAMSAREYAVAAYIDAGVDEAFFDENPAVGEVEYADGTSDTVDRSELDAAVDDLTYELSGEIGQFQPLQLITHAFLHGGLLHLAGNMLFLIVFGTRVNSVIGNVPTLILYPLLGVIAGWAHMASVSGGVPIPMLGASGAVMGMCGLYLILFPLQKVHMVVWLRMGLITGFRLFKKIFSLPGIIVVGAYIAFDVLYVAAKLESGTAHWAHIGGFIAGVVAAIVAMMIRLVPPGANLLSIIGGKYAWLIIGRPTRRP